MICKHVVKVFKMLHPYIEDGLIVREAGILHNVEKTVPMSQIWIHYQRFFYRREKTNILHGKASFSHQWEYNRILYILYRQKFGRRPIVGASYRLIVRLSSPYIRASFPFHQRCWRHFQRAATISPHVVARVSPDSIPLAPISNT